MMPLQNEPELHIALGVLVLGLLGIIIWDLVVRKARTGGQTANYLVTIVVLWALTGVVAWAWLASGRTPGDMGLVAPTGWQGWAAWGVVGLVTAFLGYGTIALARSGAQRQQTIESISQTGDLKNMIPRTGGQFMLFQGVAVTAGITEEVLFRAFAITVAALWMPLWAAAIAALVLFIVGHAYQGLSGMLRLIPIGAVLTAMYVFTGSLVPGIVLHVLIDVIGGIQLFLLRKEADALEASSSG